MTGTEPVKIPPATEIPLCWTHKGILAAFENVATDPANGAATKYRESGTKWTQALEQFRQRMQVSIASAWEGSSADASVNAIRQYTTDADKLTPAFTTMSDQVTAAATSAVNTKTSLPGEVDPGFLDSMPWNKAVVRGQREDAEDDARDVMSNKYVAPFAGTDNAIPVLPRPTNPTRPQDDPGDDPAGGDTDNGGGQPDTDSGTTQPSSTTQDDSSEDPAEDSTSEDSTTEDPSSTEDSSTDDDNGTDTTPADTDQGTNSPSTTPAATSPAGTNPGSPGTSPGSSGGPGGTSGLPVVNTPGAGKAVQGSSPIAPLAAAASAGGGAAVAGGRGATGMPGMMAPGAGRGKDDESEHKIPDYLINDSNTNELIGELPSTVRGGVLGSHFPSANPPRTDRPAGEH